MSTEKQFICTGRVTVKVTGGDRGFEKILGKMIDGLKTRSKKKHRRRKRNKNAEKPAVGSSPGEEIVNEKTSSVSTWSDVQRAQHRSASEDTFALNDSECLSERPFIFDHFSDLNRSAADASRAATDHSSIGSPGDGVLKMDEYSCAAVKPLNA